MPQIIAGRCVMRRMPSSSVVNCAVEQPGADVVRRPLGAVVAVGVRAAVAGADDHVRVALRVGVGLGPVGVLAVPEELRLEVVGGGQLAHDVGGVHAALLGELREALADRAGVAAADVDEDRRAAAAAAASSPCCRRCSGGRTPSRSCSPELRVAQALAGARRAAARRGRASGRRRRRGWCRASS